LHDVAKWTVPSRWSDSSCANADCADASPAAAIAASAVANADLIMVSLPSSFGADNAGCFGDSTNSVGRQQFGGDARPAAN